MMFHVFCAKGYGLGLDKAARGMGLPGKTAGMDGSMAPLLWKNREFQKVLDYVAQDVRAPSTWRASWNKTSSCAGSATEDSRSLYPCRTAG